MPHFSRQINNDNAPLWRIFVNQANTGSRSGREIRSPQRHYVKVGNDWTIISRFLHGAPVDERLVHWGYNQISGNSL